MDQAHSLFVVEELLEENLWDVRRWGRPWAHLQLQQSHSTFTAQSQHSHSTVEFTVTGTGTVTVTVTVTAQSSHSRSRSRSRSHIHSTDTYFGMEGILALAGALAAEVRAPKDDTVVVKGREVG